MYKNFVYTILIFLYTNVNCHGQSTEGIAADSLNRKKLIIVAAGTGAGWAGSMTALYSAWYSQEQLSGFHFFDDSKNWLQMDKAGHVYTAWKINELTTSMFRWTGLNRRTSLLIGSSVSFGYQATLEIFDGLSEDWGFSWSDLTANTVGVLGFAAQDLMWNEQRIIPKFSSHPTEFAAYRPSVLGSNFGERLLKDYNGQTYWLSFSPSTFFEHSKIPKWLCVSIGYSAHERLVGSEDLSTFSKDGVTRNFDSSREWLLSLDIDFSRIPVKRTWLRKTLNQLNYLKIPFPAVMLRNGVFYGKPLYF